MAILLGVLVFLAATLLLFNPHQTAVADGTDAIAGTVYKAPPQSGVWPYHKVYLWDSNYTLLDSTTTDGNGLYSISMYQRAHAYYYIDDRCRYDSVYWGGGTVYHNLTGACT